jgi:hypothetical protein
VQEGGLVGGVCSGLLTAVEFNARTQGASQGAKETTRARNRRKTHRGARSTCAGGRVKSGDVDLVSSARYSSIPGSGSFTKVRRGYPEGRTGRGMARVASLWWSSLAAAGTPCAERSPVILCSGEVESERGRTVEASVSFIGAGAGVGTGLAWRGATCMGSSARRALAARARQTRGCVILPKFLRLLSTQTCESCYMACVRFLPCT